jgi:hypothetical protein
MTFKKTKSRTLVQNNKIYFCAEGACGMEFTINTEKELNLKLKLHRKKCMICNHQMKEGLVEYTEKTTHSKGLH